MATPSKNQRSGPKLKQKKLLCSQGHEQVHANYAARGRKRMILICECNFAPMNRR